MRTHGPARWPAIATGLLLALLWYALWRLAEFAGVAPNTSLWYPPAGLTLAAALALPPRRWPIFAAMVVGGSALGRDPAVWLDAPGQHAMLALVQGAAHGLPFYIGARLLRRRFAGAAVSSVMPILLLLPLMAAGSAALGTLVVIIAGGAQPTGAWTVFTAWFTGDLIGAATTAPLFILLLPHWLRCLGIRARATGSGRSLAPPSGRGLALVGATLGALAVTTLQPPLAAAPGGITIWVYPLLLGMLLIGRFEPAIHAYAVLALASFLVVVTGERAGLDPARGEPHLILLAMAVLAQLGVAFRRLQDERDRDSLTGVLGRAAWRRIARAQLRRAGPWTLVMVDLDDFKGINDGFGHAQGDAVLRRVARTLEHDSPAEALVGRLGGDEFVLLVPGDAAVTARATQRLRHALKAEGRGEGGNGVAITASFGLTTALAGESLDVMLQRADAALLRAKGGGRDRVVGASLPAVDAAAPVSRPAGD